MNILAIVAVAHPGHDAISHSEGGVSHTSGDCSSSCGSAVSHPPAHLDSATQHKY